MKRVVDWVATAWREIQNKYIDWRWMHRSFTGTTTTGQSEYAATVFTDTTDSALISRFGRWLTHDDTGYSLMTVYATAPGVSGERYLTFLPWEAFRTIYRFGTQNNGVPVHFSITPANKFAIGPAPDATGYTVNGDYQMSAQELSADANTPEMPTRFHMLIVYEGMKKYASYESAPEVYESGKNESGRMWGDLILDQRPSIPLSEPLA